MAKSITVYTRTTCASCVNVKKYLDMKQQAYDVVNLDDQPELTDEVVAKSGARTVPVIIVRDDTTAHEHVSVGWNPGGLAAALAA